MLSEDFLRHVLAHPLQYSDGCAALAREVLRLRALSEPVWGDEQSEAIQSVESSGPMPTDRIPFALDRELLRSAGEHIGALAERAHERLAWTFEQGPTRTALHNRWARLHRISREILELAEEAPDGR